MSNAAATAAATDAPAPKKKSKKTLIIIAAAVVLVLVVGGVAAMLLMKKKHADEGDGEDAADAHPAKAEVKHDPKAVPIFVPLDPFTVNLADKEAERYAQVGMTLEIADAKVGDQLKAFMPAIRHAILMVLADKTAGQLMDREGKLKMAQEVRREVSHVLGFDAPEEEAEEGEAAPPKKGAKKDGKADPKAGKKKKAAAAEWPIRAVHFSNFIVQ